MELSEVIRAQRCQLRRMTDITDIAEVLEKLHTLESQLREAIMDQDARLRKLRENNVGRPEVISAVKVKESLQYRLAEAILAQTGRVREARSRSEVSRSVARLEVLKADYRAVTGREWSEVRGLLIINLINNY